MRYFSTFVLSLLLGLLWPQSSFANWTNLGIYGGRVYAVAIDPNSPNTLFAGTYQGGGLFTSRDGGQNWEAVQMDHLREGEDTFQGHAVYDVAIAPSDSNVVWAAHNFWAARSDDGGATWSHIYNGTMQRDCDQCGGYYDAWRLCLSIAIHPANPDIVYVGTSPAYGAATQGAVYRSDNGGSSWTKMNQGQNLDHRVEDLAVDAANPDIVWAVTNSNGVGGQYDGSVYRSEDGGAHFTAVNTATLGGGLLAVAPKPDDPDVVFVAGGMGLVRLTRAGGEWIADNPVSVPVFGTDIQFAPGSAQTLYAAVNLMAGPAVLRSDDGGSTWDAPGVFVDGATFPAALAVDPVDHGRIYFGDNTLGIMRTEDQGISWNAINNGLDAVIVFDVDVDTNDTSHMIAASNAGLFERLSADDEWIRRHPGIFRAVCFKPGDGSAYFAGIDGIILRTDNHWQSWAASNDLNGAHIRDISVHPQAPDTVFIGTGGTNNQMVQRSTDGGATFAPVLNVFQETGRGYDINAVTIDPADAQHILAGGGNFFVPKVLGDLWESSDGGENWQLTNLTGQVINDVLIDPRDADVFYAGCGYSSNYDTPLFKSTDGGATWAAAIDGLPNRRIRTFDIWSAHENHAVAVGWDGSVFLFDGHAVTQPASGTDNDLYGVHGLSADAVWAVGVSGTIIHFNGSQWSSMPSPVSVPLYSVWAAAADNVFAVGENGTILHYDGLQWSVMDSGTSQAIYSIHGVAGDRVLAVGPNGLALYYDGHQWSATSSGTPNTFVDVWASGSGDFYIVGNANTVMHFDGSVWTHLDPGVTDKSFTGVWGHPDGDLYISAGTGAEVIHYDGTAWSTLPLPEARFADDLWGTAGGSILMTDAGSGIFRFDGSQWIALRTPGTPYRSVTDLAFHRTNFDIVYAGTYGAGIFISPNGAANWLDLGTPPSSVYAIASGSLYAATGAGMYQLTGTGVIAGTVRDTDGLAPIDQATVTTDLGNRCTSVMGDYMMVVPAGIFDLFALAPDYQLASASDVTVYGSDVTWMDFSLTLGSGIIPSGGPDDGSSVSGSAGGGGYCFIGALQNGGSGNYAAMAFFSMLAMAAVPVCLRWTRAVCAAALLSCAVWCLLPGTAFTDTIFQQVGVASAPVPVGSGARASGMGGAFIAVADDATAASWNPAGLIQLEQPEVSMVGAGTLRRTDFESDSHPEIANSGDDSHVDLNYFSAVYPVAGFRNMVFSVNYQQLYDFTRSFDHRLALRDDSGLQLDQQIDYDQSGQVGAVGFAGAVELSPRISVGATLNLWTEELGWDNGWEERYRVHSSTTLGSSPVTIDTAIRDRFKQFRGINANIGVLWETRQWGRFGAVVKTPFTASLVHEFRFQSTQVIGPPENRTATSGPIRIDETVKLKMPLSYGAGWSRRIGDAWTVALDLSRTHWDDYTYIDAQGNEFSPIDGRTKDRSQVDPTTHVRLGAEYLFMLPQRRLVLPVRCGLFYDPEPGEGGSQEVYGLALGGGVTHRRFSVDLAYQYRWGRDLDSGNLIVDSRADIDQHTILASLIYYFGSASN